MTNKIDTVTNGIILMECNIKQTMGDYKMTHNKTNKWVRFALLSTAVLSVGLANSSCDKSGDVTTDDTATAPTATATPIPLGDDTATELADDVIDGGNDVTESPFMKLWELTSFATIDDCFDGCDTEYPDGDGGNKTTDNVDCVEQCKIEYPE